jgi:hypothetical protein
MRVLMIFESLPLLAAVMTRTNERLNKTPLARSDLTPFLNDFVHGKARTAFDRRLFAGLDEGMTHEANELGFVDD